MSTEEYTPESDWARSLQGQAHRLQWAEPCLARCCTSDFAVATAYRHATSCVETGEIKSLQAFFECVRLVTEQLRRGEYYHEAGPLR